jgi:membrane-bound serine protease (ClpP class)
LSERSFKSNFARLALLSVLILLFLVPVFVSLSGNTSPYSIIRVEGASNQPIVIVNLDVPIDQGSNGLLSRAVQTANSANAAGVIINMNTPGGLVSDMLAMVNSINSSKAPVYTFVGPNALAASAGSYIAMATKTIFMAPGSEIGPSTPIVEGGSALQQNHTEDALLSLMQGLAQENGRNVSAVTNMVVNDIAYTYLQALQYHVADRQAGSLSEVLADLNLSSESQIVLSENAPEQLVSILSNAVVDGILLLVGIIAIVLDFLHPTVLLSIAGVVLIALGLIGAEAIEGPTLNPAVIVPIIFFALAATLIVFELKTGHGFLLFAGVVVGAIGTLLLTYEIPYSPSPIGGLQYLEIGLIVVFGAFIGIYARWVGKTIRKKPVTGSESLVGKMGIVVSDLSPEGEVSVDGVIWRAKLADGSAVKQLAKGSSVIVDSRAGLSLIVKPEQIKEKAQLSR